MSAKCLVLLSNFSVHIKPQLIKFALLCIVLGLSAPAALAESKAIYGKPKLTIDSELVNREATLSLHGTKPNADTYLMYSDKAADYPWHYYQDSIKVDLTRPNSGILKVTNPFSLEIPQSFDGLTYHSQIAAQDPTAPGGYAFSDRMTTNFTRGFDFPSYDIEMKGFVPNFGDVSNFIKIDQRLFVTTEAFGMSEWQIENHGTGYPLKPKRFLHDTLNNNGFSEFTDIAVSADKKAAILTSYSRLWVVSLTNPVWIKTLAKMYMQYPVDSPAIINDLALLRSSTKGLLVLSISDPSAPKELEIKQFDYVTKIVKYGNNKLVVFTSPGDTYFLEVIGNSANYQIIQRGHIKLATYSWGEVHEGQTKSQIVVRNWDDENIRAYDITNPNSIYLVDAIAPGFKTAKISIANDELYLSHPEKNIYTFKISASGKLTYQTVYETPQAASKVSTDNNFLYIGGRQGYWPGVHVMKKANKELLENHPYNNYYGKVFNPVLSENGLVLLSAKPKSGVAKYDLYVVGIDPQALHMPKVINTIPDYFNSYAHYQENIILASHSENNRFQMMYLHNDGNITELGSCATSPNPRKIRVDRERQLAFVLTANSEDGFDIIDISNPYNPYIIKTFKETAWLSDLVLKGNIAYMSSWGNPELAIYDFSDITNPTFLGAAPTSQPLYNCALSQGYAYCKQGSRDLVIFDCRDRYNPKKIKVIDFGLRWLLDVNTHKDALLLTFKDYDNTSRKIETYDISSPSQPVFVNKFINTRANNYDLIITKGDYLLASDDSGLLLIAHMDSN